MGIEDDGNFSAESPIVGGTRGGKHKRRSDVRKRNLDRRLSHRMMQCCNQP